MSLSAYARAHLRLLGIQQRFNMVIQRRVGSMRDVWDKLGVVMAAGKARSAGDRALEQAWEDQQRFDEALK